MTEAQGTTKELRFPVAVLDGRWRNPQHFPVHIYELMFVLRYADFAEMGAKELEEELQRLAERWPDMVAQIRESLHLGPGGVWGYFRFLGRIATPRKVWFEVSDDAIRDCVKQVGTVEGLEVYTSPEVYTRHLNHTLRKHKFKVVAIPRSPWALKQALRLPDEFRIYELRVRLPGGGVTLPWGIAFGKEAEELDKRHREWEESMM